MKRRRLSDALLEIRRENEEVFSEKYLVRHLFEDAKYFVERAKEYERANALISRRYIRGAVTSAFAGLEALANIFCEILSEHGELELHERALVQDQRVELGEEGYFEIRGQRLRSLDDKIKFLHWRVHGVPITEQGDIWKPFLDAKTFRNSIVHPRPRELSYSEQTVTAAESCFLAVLRVAQMLGWELPPSAESKP